jgi:tetratricopeptide (TPR) repeat protein
MPELPMVADSPGRVHGCVGELARGFGAGEGAKLSGAGYARGVRQPSDDATLDATLPAEPHSAGRPAPELARGESLGRYLILDLLGSGGMGKVYAAYDPKLDRKLAIKLLHHAPGSEASGTSVADSSRLEREAQAMAKLSHRNVVAVHDVGTHAGQVFVAMEFVEGSSLDAWLEQGAHPWHEVLAHFIAAGRGLAAAHAAGLIHRDFKPANVLLGRDGRVRVADFGLARRTGEASERSGSIPLDRLEGGVDSFSLRLTQTGAFVGTPAYMAPEQFRGDELDARSDQFSFCVALWEALYGERPFAGDSPAAIIFAICEGKLRAPSPAVAAAVPGWLRRVVERGLASEPADRWPDMEALLRALSRDPARGRRRVGAVVLAVLGLVALVVGPRLWAEPEPAAPPLCQGAEAAFAEVWGAGEREAIHARYAALDQGWASDVEARLLARLDTWAGGWTATWTEACAATRIRGEQSEEMLDDRMLCLDRRRARFATFVTALAEADDALLRKATARVDDIGDVGDCSDPEAMHARVPPPADPARRAEFEALLAEFDAVTAQRTIGRYDVAKARLEPAYARALASAHPTLVAEARYIRGDLLAQLDEAEAEAELEGAYEAALAAGLFAHAARAAEDLCSSLLVRDERQAEAERWLRTAEALVTYLDHPGLRVQLLWTRGRLERYRGNFDAAVTSFEQALALAREGYGEDAQRTGDAHFNLSTAFFDRGDVERARAEVEVAEAIWTDELGPLDPRTLVALNARGVFAWRAGDWPAAEELYKNLLERKEQLFGPDHRQVAAVLFNYGALLGELGDPRGIELLEQVAAIYEREYGPDGTSTAQAKVNLATALVRAGEGHETRALALVDEALATMRSRRADTHPEVLVGTSVRVELLRRGGDAVAAEALATELLERFEGAGEEMSPLQAEVHVELARMALGRGDPAAALEQLEHAESITDPQAMGARKTIEREILAARILRALGRGAEARPRAEAARAGYLEIAPASSQDALWREIDAWFTIDEEASP